VLFASGTAGAEIVARNGTGGLLALNAKGVPSVAYVRGTRVLITTRAGKENWRAVTAASTTPGTTVRAFKIGPAGPVALVQSSDDRALSLVRKNGKRWQTIRIATVGTTMALGWPGLALDAKGLPAVAYARWNSLNLNTQLQLVRVDARGKPSTQSVTRGGFPRSMVPPSAAPVFVAGRLRVVEAYGFDTVTGAFEWYPNGKTWTGLGIDVSRGEFPVGPLLAGLLQGRLYAAWSISMAAFEATPVTLAERIATTASSEFVLDRALTSALALPASGVEVAANQWVTADELGLGGENVVWAGTVVKGEDTVELDGWIGGLAVAPNGGRDVLLERGGNLEWYRSPSQLATSMRIRAFPGSGGVEIDGTVRDANGGHVTIYRERVDGTREIAGTAQLSSGSFSFTDTSPARPLVYRAVYTAPGSGIPFGALSRPVL
jgi:hypothetical protein